MVYLTRCKPLGTVSARGRRNSVSDGSTRLLPPAHRRSWSDSGVRIRLDNRCDSPVGFATPADRLRVRSVNFNASLNISDGALLAVFDEGKLSNAEIKRGFLWSMSRGLN